MFEQSVSMFTVIIITVNRSRIHGCVVVDFSTILDFDCDQDFLIRRVHMHQATRPISTKLVRGVASLGVNAPLIIRLAIAIVNEAVYLLK